MPRARWVWLGALVATPACGQIVDLGPERTRFDSASSTGGAAGSGGEAGQGGASCPLPGDVVWAERYGDAAAQAVTAVEADGDGGVFIAGAFDGTLSLGGVPLVSTVDGELFFAHLDGRGQASWSKQLGTAGLVVIKRAPAGDVLLGGRFVGTIDPGGGAITADGVNAFVARFGADGTHRWTTMLGGAGVEEVGSLAVGPDGAIWVAGMFSEELSIDGTQHVSAGSNDAYLARLGSNGEHQWSRAFGGTGPEYGHAVAVDAAGRIAFGGATTSAIDLGNGVLFPGEGNDAFVALYGAELSAIWARLYGGPGEQDLRRLAFDPISGDLFVLGALFGSTTAFGQGQIAATRGAFLARLNQVDGSGLASRAILEFEAPNSLAFDSAGDLVLSGPFHDYSDFGAGPIKAVGESDGVIVKMSSWLEPRWVRQIGGAAPDAVRAAIDAESVYAAGYFAETLRLDGCAPITLTSAGDRDALLARLRL